MSPRRDHDVRVWWVRLAGVRDLTERAIALLSADERERADRYRFPWLRQDYALCRAILRLLLARWHGGAPGDVVFHYNPYGKPALADAPAFQFNVAHSGGVAAYALSLDADVGIDVETARRMPDMAAIATRFFAASEQAELMGLDPDLQHAAFFECWTRKEAYIKAVGRGLSIPLDSFRVALAPGHDAALLEVRDAPHEARQWSMHAFSPAPGYHGAVALRRPHSLIQVAQLDARDLLDGGAAAPQSGSGPDI